MRTVGDILHKARLEKKLSLEEISRQTRIHVKYLKAIEANDFDALPASAFAKGFMRNFAKAVELNPDNVLAIFRRDYDQDEHGRIVPRSLAEPIHAPKNIFNPRTTTLVLSLIVGVLIVGFFVRQVMVFRSAPDLAIEVPVNQAELVSPVEVAGTTSPQAVVLVNNRPVSVDENGNFRSQIPLTPGEHTLVVVARSRSNKETVDERVVMVLEE